MNGFMVGLVMGCLAGFTTGILFAIAYLSWWQPLKAARRKVL